MTTNNVTEPLVVERTFDASAAQLWKALTEVEEMRRWYFDLKEFRAEPGFEFEFTVEHEGMRYCHQCRVTRLELAAGEVEVHVVDVDIAAAVRDDLVPALVAKAGEVHPRLTNAVLLAPVQHLAGDHHLLPAR